MYLYVDVDQQWRDSVYTAAEEPYEGMMENTASAGQEVKKSSTDGPEDD